MKSSALTLLAFSLLSTPCISQLKAESKEREDLLQRGKYLVENVGNCADCHTPRNQHGEFIADQRLKGADITFAPIVPMPAWAAIAPQIAGLPNMSESQAVSFFQTGQRAGRTPPRPPMPSFRFNKEDATAVAAYLKSLPK